MATKKECSRIQENSISKYLGWLVVTGSGSRPTSIGDIQSSRLLGECKTHIEPGHKIEFKQNVWNKIKSEANSRFKSPCLFVDDGSRKYENTWCMTDIHLDGDVVDYPHKYSKNILFRLEDIPDRERIYRVVNFGSSRTVYIINLVYLKSNFGDEIC